MPRKKQSRGICAYCGREISKGPMIRHLGTCTERQRVIDKAEMNTGFSETLYHLRVEDAWWGEYWLNLEMRGSAKLKDLDRYLRAIWLECCGHPSRFSTGGWDTSDIPMSCKAKDVFTIGSKYRYQYDFGTTSEILIKVVSSRLGKPTTRYPIALMARNRMSPVECMECGKPATWLCTECVYDEDESGWLCDTHQENHPHENYGGPIPVVNSPRLGMCGYDGPAVPPY